MVVTSSHRVSDPSQLTDGEGDPAPLLVAPKPLKESPVRQAIEHLKSATKKRDEEHAAGKITWRKTIIPATKRSPDLQTDLARKKTQSKRTFLSLFPLSAMLLPSPNGGRGRRRSTAGSVFPRGLDWRAKRGKSLNSGQGSFDSRNEETETHWLPDERMKNTRAKTLLRLVFFLFLFQAWKRRAESESATTIRHVEFRRRAMRNTCLLWLSTGLQGKSTSSGTKMVLYYVTKHTWRNASLPH